VPPVDVRLRDGIEIDLPTGTTVVADARSPAGDVAVCSHAHGDHLYGEPPGALVCSAATAELASLRRSELPRPEPADHPAVELAPAGHVAGSRAAYCRDGETTVLFTGDVSVRDRFFLDGFDPEPADVLVLESTYGKPEYVFPPQDEVEAAIVDFLEDVDDAPVVLFGYALGRAQELLLLAREAAPDGLYTTPAVERINRVIEDHCDVTFPGERYDSDEALESGDVVVLPSQTSSLGFVDRLVEDGAVAVGVSGWAVDESYRYRGGFDETFALSDHADYEELQAIASAVDPDVVYTHHGFAEELARTLRGELGYDTRALKRNQSTLGDF
jgi:putative mRNA 3-end processing factor